MSFDYSCTVYDSRRSVIESFRYDADLLDCFAFLLGRRRAPVARVSWVQRLFLRGGRFWWDDHFRRHLAARGAVVSVRFDNRRSVCATGKAVSVISAQMSPHIYEVRPRKDKRGVNLISDALPFGRLWYAGPDAVANAIGYAEHRSRSHDAVIRVYDDAGNMIETHEHAGDFKEW